MTVYLMITFKYHLSDKKRRTGILIFSRSLNRNCMSSWFKFFFQQSSSCNSSIIEARLGNWLIGGNIGWISITISKFRFYILKLCCGPLNLTWPSKFDFAHVAPLNVPWPKEGPLGLRLGTPTLDNHFSRLLCFYLDCH